jgi:site-specific recombinase XerD
MKINPKNERMKRTYRIYLKEARQLDEQSIDAIDKAMDRFERYTKRRDFREFREEQAIAFKRHLAEQNNVRTGERLSKATIYSTLTALKDFFFWLAGQPGFKGRLRYDAADYFKISLKDVTAAKATCEGRVPSLEQIRAALAAMPVETPVGRRNRALVAFTILTGARDNAMPRPS